MKKTNFEIKLKGYLSLFILSVLIIFSIFIAYTYGDDNVKSMFYTVGMALFLFPIINFELDYWADR